MGSGKFILLILFVWVTGMVLGATFENVSAWSTTNTIYATAGAQTPQTMLSYIMNISNAVQKLTVWNVGIPLPMPNPDYWLALFRVITWQFPFMIADFGLAWYFLCLPWAAYAIINLVSLFNGILRGNITWG